MTKLNTFVFTIYYDLPRFDPDNGVRWETHEEIATILVPSHIRTADQAQKFLYEMATTWGHEHVRYEDFCLHDDDCVL